MGKLTVLKIDPLHIDSEFLLFLIYFKRSVVISTLFLDTNFTPMYQNLVYSGITILVSIFITGKQTKNIKFEPKFSIYM